MIQVGDTITKTIDVSEVMVRDFARVSGDFNPLHIDEEYAAHTRFGKRIAHGMLLASFISSVIANDLPGPGTIYIEQILQFQSPLFIGETIIISITCIEVLQKSRVRLSTNGTKPDGTFVIQGEVLVLAPD